MPDPIEEIIRKYALQNAVFFKGTANPKAIVGKVLAECPDLRARSKEVTEIAGSVVSEVNAMGLEAQTAALREIDPDMMVREKKERKYELPELEDASNVVMRIAPGPSGPLHIGHSRVSVLNDEYVKRYGGRLINRFEDTNPEKIDPDAYRMIAEDLDWLGVKVHETICQSDRFQTYYGITRQMVAAGHGYVCTCDAEHWRGLKENKQECPCRSLPADAQLERFDRMMSNGYGEGEAVAVIKTDIAHPNPAIRDFVALRIVNTPHPRTGSRYNVYPMMNLAVAIDDHLLGMTPVIRGKDHLNNTYRQEYIYGYMGWKKPRFYHYGLVNIEDTVLKTSLIGKCIKNGELTGWNDVRTGTLRALERRGIRPEAIRRYWVEAGMKQIEVQFSWDTLYAMNRDIIDGTSDRYFFVSDPVRIVISGIGEIKGAAQLHPDHPERGYRNYTVREGEALLIQRDDHQLLSSAGTIRLKDLCNIGAGDPVTYAGADPAVLRKGVRAVQWVKEGSIPAQVLMPDGSVSEGCAENALLGSKGATVQFERFGFVKIEDIIGGRLSAVFTHR
jgi:glutamyl-tRNA synthetase